MSKRVYFESSGNVFQDLNLPHAEDLMAKAELAARILAEIEQRRLTPIGSGNPFGSRPAQDFGL